jgi:hypothetical protein
MNKIWMISMALLLPLPALAADLTGDPALDRWLLTDVIKPTAAAVCPEGKICSGSQVIASYVDHYLPADSSLPPVRTMTFATR